MHGQMHNTTGVSSQSTILCLFGHVCNDFAEKCVKIGGQTGTSKAGRKKETEGLS